MEMPAANPYESLLHAAPLVVQWDGVSHASNGHMERSLLAWCRFPGLGSLVGRESVQNVPQEQTSGLLLSKQSMVVRMLLH